MEFPFQFTFSFILIKGCQGINTNNSKQFGLNIPLKKNIPKIYRGLERPK